MREIHETRSCQVKISPDAQQSPHLSCMASGPTYCRWHNHPCCHDCHDLQIFSVLRSAGLREARTITPLSRRPAVEDTTSGNERLHISASLKAHE